MERLEALTQELVRNLSGISFKQKDHVVYNLEQGTAITFTLTHKPGVMHVLDSFLSAGTIFPLHEHEDSSETLILQEGEVTVICTDESCDQPFRHELKVGVPYFIPSRFGHVLHAKKDSWILATLIPPDAGMLK